MGITNGSRGGGSGSHTPLSQVGEAVDELHLKVEGGEEDGKVEVRGEGVKVVAEVALVERFSEEAGGMPELGGRCPAGHVRGVKAFEKSPEREDRPGEEAKDDATTREYSCCSSCRT